MSDEPETTDPQVMPYDDLVDAIKEKLEFYLSSQVVSLFKTADETLFDMANAAASIDEQNRMFEFMNALRTEKEGIEKNFIQEINLFIRPISEARGAPKKKTESEQSDQLGLIEQDEMDEMVALSTISSKAQGDNREELSHLEARLEHLALQNNSIFPPRALQPKNLSDAFKQAVAICDFDIKNKLILYKVFGQEIITPLRDLYKELNQIMIEAGILPQIDLSGKIKRTPSDVPPVEDEYFEDEPQSPAMGAGARRGGGVRPASGGGTSGMGSTGPAASPAMGTDSAGAPGMGSAGGAGPGMGAGVSGGPGMGAAGGAEGMAGGPGGGGVGSASGSGLGAAGGAGAVASGPGVGEAGSAGATGMGATGGAGAVAGGAGVAAGSPEGGPGGGAAAEASVVASGPGTGAAATAGHSASVAGDTAGAVAPQASHTGQAEAGSATSGEASVSGYTAGMPVGQVRESINNFVGGEPTRPDEAVAGAGGGAYYSHQDVVTALSSMQSQTTVAAPGTKLEFDAASIKKAVLTSIGEKHGGVVDKRVNHVSEKTIDFIKLIFDAIIADKSITDSIKALLLSLQIPVIKAAMIDSNFFVDDQHPARQLLDKLAEAGLGVSEHKDPIYVEIEKIVRKLLQDYDEDVTAFNIALDELNAVMSELAGKAQEREAEAQRQLKHSHARNVVLQEIRKITLGHELPVDVHTLVLKVWPSLMFNHFLHHGKANDEWVEMLMILAKIIDSVQPLTNTSELKELGLSYEDVIAAAENKLRTSKRSEALITQAIGGLRLAYEKLMSTPNLPDIEQPVESGGEVPAGEANETMETGPVPRTDAEVSIETENKAEPEQETPEQIAQRKVEALPEDVKPGAWFIVYNGDDKPVRRLKLAVILVQTATLMFVDHLGNIVIEKDAEEFADELKQDLSGIIMQHSVFDHALNSALQSINS